LRRATRWRCSLRVPFSLGTADLLHDLLEPAWPGLEVTRHDGEARFGSLGDWLYSDIRG
jgi:hypothetical protein